MRLLVVVELRADAPSVDSLALVSRAAALADDTSAFVWAPHTDELVSALGAAGAGRIVVVPDTGEAPGHEARVDALTQLCREESFDAVLLVASARLTDLAAAAAVRLGAGLNWDLTDLFVVDGELRASRPLLGDSVLAEVGWRGDGPALALVRPGVTAGADVMPVQEPEVRALTLVASDAWARVEVSTQPAPTDMVGPRLDDADVVVAGGRGMGSAEGLGLIRELADALHGVAGVSLPVVAQGWAPYSMQVGQTGRIVRPRLYVACGISGQVQHRVGMERSGEIVAINSDPKAPIFGFCDVAVLGDLHAIIPRALELLRAQALAGHTEER